LGREWRDYRRPEPRIELGQKLRQHATACIDLTDGLSLDLHRLSTASGVSAALDRVAARRGYTIEQALNGGEDYELLWTMPLRRTPPSGAIRIGAVIPGTPGLVLLNGAPVPIAGYDHFQQ
jgi:thiamine-monophosphate kinase